MVDIANRLKTIASSDGWMGGKIAILLTGFALTAMITMISLLQPSLLQKADLFVYDLLLTSRAVSAPSADPVLVAIDEASLATYGQWPWPRYRLAMLMEHLQAQGAKVVALDFLMPEPDRTSPEVIRQERRRDRVENPVLSPADGADSNSQRLAEALAKGPTILGYFLNFENTGTRTASQAPPKVPDGMVITRLAGYRGEQAMPSGQLRSLPALTAAASAEGFTNAQEDIDGTLRRVPLLLTMDGKAYPSLALATLLTASSERHIQLANEDDENILYWDHRRIPLDASGNMLIDFRRSPPQTISAQDILQIGRAHV